MSLVDARLECSSAQALTASADSTNVIDLTGTALQVGAGRPLYMHFNVTVAADFTSSDETYSFGVATGAAASLGTVLLIYQIKNRIAGNPTLTPFKALVLLAHVREGFSSPPSLGFHLSIKRDIHGYQSQSHASWLLRCSAAANR